MTNQVAEKRARKRDWVTPVAVGGGALAVGFGLWFFMRKTAAGGITGIWVNKGSDSKKPIPYTTNADGQTFEVGVSYKNIGKEAVVLGAEVVVTKPDGDLVQPTVDMAGADVGEVLTVEYNISKVDQVGEWPITVRIITEKGDVLDEFSGIVLNVVEEVAEGDWGGPGVILARGQFEIAVTQAVPGDWFPPNAELDRVSFEALVEAGAPGDWFPPDTELDRTSFLVSVTGGGAPGPEAPEIDTKRAEKVTHDSATLSMELIDEGFCSGAYCYIEWGKTAAYGNKTDVVRLQPGWEESFDIEGLEPDTKYYFRAVAEGRCKTPYLVGYGQGRSFTTEEEEVVGFGLRVEGAPSNAKYWNCSIDWETGEEAELWPPIPMSSTWHFDGEVPTSRVKIRYSCYEKSTGGAYVKSHVDQYRYRLYAGSNYVFDFSTLELREE